MADSINFQHFRVKLFAEAGGSPDLHQAIPVFHRWIRERRLPESAIDVSDYLHVPAGPGVILVCHEAIYGLDLEKNRLGLMYNQRVASDLTNTVKLLHAVDAVGAAARQLEAEPEFEGKLNFDWDQWEIVVNDRALAPNTAATFEQLRPVIKEVFAGSLEEFSIVHASAASPGELLRVRVSAA